MMQDQNQIKVLSVKREHGKAYLTLSNGSVRTMPRAMLRERPYKSGMVFDDESFEVLLKERSYPFAMDKAVALLSMRARTEKEIVDALKRNAYPEEAIARVMARLHENGYINDAEFAAQYSSARVTRGLGAKRIRMDLRLKGVDAEVIDEAIQTLDQDEVLNSAIKAAQKAARGKELNDRSDRQKILAALARRGFDFSVAKKALDAILGN